MKNHIENDCTEWTDGWPSPPEVIPHEVGVTASIDLHAPVLHSLPITCPGCGRGHLLDMYESSYRDFGEVRFHCECGGDYAVTQMGGET